MIFGDIKSLHLGHEALSHAGLALIVTFPLVILMGPVVNCCSPPLSFIPLVLDDMMTKPQDATLSHSALPCTVSRQELWSSLKYLHRKLEDERSFPLLSKILG